MIELRTEKPILCIGDVCPDIILPYGATQRILAAVARGEVITGEQKSAEIAAGGSIGNTAHGIAVLGGKSWFAGKVGNDYFGRFLKQTFETAGVDTRCLVMDESIPTSMVIAVLDENQGRITYVIPRNGASQHLLEKSDLPVDLLDQIGWLHTSGILLRENPAAETILELIEGCRKRSIPVSLDMNLRIEAVGDPVTMQRIQRGISSSNILFGSGTDELMPVTGADSPLAAAHALVSPDRAVVCRAGSAGADVYLPDGSRSHCDAFQVPVVDTLGAGDAYNAGFITAAVAGLSLAEANRRGNAVAAWKIMHSGARNFPNRDQLEAFIQTDPVQDSD